ncbi:transcriptional regulator ATRX-like [Sinocyclocheilus anshuiensis]|uniref:transcriptional regulator ATRX-like n=1 Tax=Sinocyclocheilus anshuiensis TaxID=1608454 RepID=UPI0007B9442C|nr:PREDICTED: transcriptional regulator ATRX-like [Sinocyclocheilus anshuiensis]
MVNFIKENLLGSLKEFRNRFINPIQNGQCADSTPADVRLMKNRSHILHQLMSGFIQRRDYSVLMACLPPKHEYVLSVRMTSLQCQLYTHYLQNYTGKGVGVNNLFQDLHVLSLIWTHPWCLKLAQLNRNKGKEEEPAPVFTGLGAGLVSDSVGYDSEGREATSTGLVGDGERNTDPVSLVSGSNQNPQNPDVTNTATMEISGFVVGNGPSADWYLPFVTAADAKVLEHSGKLQLLLEILHWAEELQDKMLVFSQSLITLDLIESFLLYADETRGNKCCPYKGKKSWVKNKDYYRLDGNISACARKRWAQEFNNTKNIRGRLFLISTRAGSLGINLVAANRVVVFDACWNPSYDIQSIFRVYRFGQKKTVYVYRFLAQGTMEQNIYKRQVAKQSLSSRVLDQQQIQRHFTHRQLNELYCLQPDLRPSKHTEMPADDMLVQLLQSCGQLIVSYHEHNSLLGHREEEELSEEERRAAWDEYRAEKKNSNEPTHRNLNQALQFIHLQQALASRNFTYTTKSVPSATSLPVKQGNAERSAAWGTYNNSNITFRLEQPNAVFSVPKTNT